MKAEAGAPPKAALRLFFALWPSGPVRSAIRRATREAVRHAGGRPSAPANYHITLVFLGEQAHDRLPAIMDAAGSLPPVAGRLTLGRVGWFERARVLWFGPEHSPPPLVRSAHALRHALAGIGIETEARPFHAHLTLARKVSRPPPPVAVRPVTWAYAGFALVASEPTPRGSRYRVLAEWPGVALPGDAAGAVE